MNLRLEVEAKDMRWVILNVSLEQEHKHTNKEAQKQGTGRPEDSSTFYCMPSAAGEVNDYIINYLLQSHNVFKRILKHSV